MLELYAGTTRAATVFVWNFVHSVLVQNGKTGIVHIDTIWDNLRTFLDSREEDSVILFGRHGEVFYINEYKDLVNTIDRSFSVFEEFIYQNLLPTLADTVSDAYKFRRIATDRYYIASVIDLTNVSDSVETLLSDISKIAVTPKDIKHEYYYSVVYSGGIECTEQKKLDELDYPMPNELRRMDIDEVSAFNKCSVMAFVNTLLEDIVTGKKWNMYEIPVILGVAEKYDNDLFNESYEYGLLRFRLPIKHHGSIYLILNLMV